MSLEKSTIDRSLPLRRQSGRRLQGSFHLGEKPAVAAPSRLPSTPPTTRPTTPLAASPLLRRTFALLERRSPAVGGLLAERLWFRLPARPRPAERAERTPSGGEAFEVRWDGGVVRGRVYGDWGSPTAYLVHGWGGWWQQLSAHVQPLLDQGLCVVAFDAPSHGDSGPGRFGARSTTFVEMARALAAVVTEFGRPTVVIAHSAGGIAALHACGLGVTPEAYVLLAPATSVDPMMRLFADVVGVGPRSCEVMITRAERRVGLPMTALDMLTTAARERSLPPLLLVHDRGDRETPSAGAVTIADAWHGARLMLTDGLGHRRIMWDTSVVERVTAFSAAAAERVRQSSR